MCVRMRRYYDATTISLGQKLANLGCSLRDIHPVASASQPEHQLHDIVSQCMPFRAMDVAVLLVYYQMRSSSAAAGLS